MCVGVNVLIEEQWEWGRFWGTAMCSGKLEKFPALYVLLESGYTSVVNLSFIFVSNGEKVIKC
jgi:hypothetical protein